MVFFFQAEDGIRDAQESRGLGDVYKRQEDFREFVGELALDHLYMLDELCLIAVANRDCPEPVSYTHLTLPTIYSV